MLKIQALSIGLNHTKANVFERIIFKDY